MKIFFYTKSQFSRLFVVNIAGLMSTISFFFILSMHSLSFTNPLCEAVRSNDFVKVERLIGDDADVNARCAQYQTTPLMIASLHGFYECGHLLLENSANTCIKDISGQTALFLAALYGQIEMLELLSKHNAELDHRDNKGNNALMKAAWGNHVDCMEYLYRNGSNLDSRNAAGETPLFWASKRGNVEAINWLLQKGANINAQDKSGKSALMLSAALGKKESIITLLSFKSPKGSKPSNVLDVQQRDTMGLTALQYITALNDIQIAEMLLQMGAECNPNTQSGSPLIFWPFIMGKEDISMYLLSHCNEVDLIRSDGCSLLHIAAANGWAEVVEYLIVTKKINPFLKFNGRTALDFAKENGHTSVKDFLNGLITNSTNTTN